MQRRSVEAFRSTNRTTGTTSLRALLLEFLVLWLRTEPVTRPFGIFGQFAVSWQICKSDDHSFNHIPLPRSTFKVIVDNPRRGVSPPPADREKQTATENPPQLGAPVLPPMSLLSTINERSRPTTPAPSSINVTVHAKSVDGNTNPRVGGMETVIEEEDVGNAETQPEEHPQRKFRFGRRKGMLGIVPRISRMNCLMCLRPLRAEKREREKRKVQIHQVLATVYL